MEQNASSHLVPPTFSAESFSAQFPGINAAANNASPLLMSTLHLSGFSNATAPFLPTATSQITLGGQFPADLANVASAAWSTQQQPWLDQAKVAAMLPMYGMLPQTVASVNDANMLVHSNGNTLLSSVPVDFEHDERFQTISVSQAARLHGQCSSTPSSASMDSRASPQRPCRVSSRVSSINVDSPAFGSVILKIPTASSSHPPSNEQLIRSSPLITGNHSNGSLPVTPMCVLDPFTSPPSTSKNYDLQQSSISQTAHDLLGSHMFTNNAVNGSINQQSISRPEDRASDIASIFANAEDAHNSVPNMNASGHFTFDHHPQQSSLHKSSGGCSNGGIDHSTFDDLSWTKDINLDDFTLNYDTTVDLHALLNSDLTTDLLEVDNSKSKDPFKADDFEKVFQRHLNDIAKKDATTAALPSFDAFGMLGAEILAPSTAEPQEKISLTPVQFTPPDSPCSDNGTDAFNANVPSTSGLSRSNLVTLDTSLENLSFLPKLDPSKQAVKVPVYKQRAQSSIFFSIEKEKQDKADAYNFSDDDENDDSPFGNLFNRDASKDQHASATTTAEVVVGGHQNAAGGEQSDVECSPHKSVVADSIRKRREMRALTSFLHAETLEEDSKTVFVDVIPEPEPCFRSPATNQTTGEENSASDLPPLPKLYIKIHRRDSTDKEKPSKKKKKKRRKREKDHEWEGSDRHKKKKKKKHKKERERNDSSSGYEARLIADDDTWRAPSSSSADGQVFSRKRRLMMWNEGDNDGGDSSVDFRKRLRMSTPTHCEVRKVDRFDEQWDPQLIKFSQASGNLGKGTFVVNKQDLFKIDSCALWRVDNQNLLQKYPPVTDQKSGKTLYRNSSTYSGWCDQIAGGYLTVATKYIKHSRVESIVEPEIPLADLFPAISEEVDDRATVSEKPTQTDDAKEMLCFGKDSLRVNFQTYIQAMLNHALSLNFLQSIKQANEWNYLCSLNEIDKTNTEGKLKIKERVKWNELFTEVVQRYSFCVISDSDVAELPCQACNANPISQIVQLFSNEYYDYDTLVPKNFPLIGGESPLPAVEYLVCSSCQHLAVLFHHFHHMRYHLLKKCEEKIEAISTEHPSFSSAEVIDACMKQTLWVKQTCEEHLTAWRKVGQL